MLMSHKYVEHGDANKPKSYALVLPSAHQNLETKKLGGKALQMHGRRCLRRSLVNGQCPRRRTTTSS